MVVLRVDVLGPRGGRHEGVAVVAIWMGGLMVLVVVVVVIAVSEERGSGHDIFWWIYPLW